MRPWLWLLLAAARPAAFHVSSVRHQSPTSLVAQTNTMVKIPCKVETSRANSRIHWLRRLQAPSASSHYEFLAAWDPAKQTTLFDKSVEPGKLSVHQQAGQTHLSLGSVKPEDSGVYFCMTIGSPELIFGKGTELTVVDVLPTTTQTTTTKTTPKRRKCSLPRPVTQKGLPCSYLTLGLLLTGVLVLLVSLGVAIHLYRLQRRAHIHFMKQFYK